MCYGNCLPLALLVFASKLPPPLRPPYVSELHTPPSPATADRSLALGPFEEQPHQLFGRSQVCSLERSQLQTWERSELHTSEWPILYNSAPWTH